ncbi:MAG TPA: hypothetical protein VGK78_07185 [Nocardioides sp.]|uniref:hypothetical protein n=1 Tax=Nocardioides sp. TaxID=35761 RepID=UPI002F408981
MPGEAWGLVDLTLITIGAAGTLWVIAHAAEVMEQSGRWVGALVRTRAVPPPEGMPIERIAADLRRIRPQARWPADGMPMVRRRAIASAYDDALLDACRALDVPTDLGRLSDALELESERLRTEAALERAGVDLG